MRIEAITNYSSTTKPIEIEEIEGNELGNKVAEFMIEASLQGRQKQTRETGKDWSEALLVGSSHTLVALPVTAEGVYRFHILASFQFVLIKDTY
jgi:hypothetical protein